MVITLMKLMASMAGFSAGVVLVGFNPLLWVNCLGVALMVVAFLSVGLERAWAMRKVAKRAWGEHWPALDSVYILTDSIIRGAAAQRMMKYPSSEATTNILDNHPRNAGDPFRLIARYRRYAEKEEMIPTEAVDRHHFVERCIRGI